MSSLQRGFIASIYHFPFGLATSLCQEEGVVPVRAKFAQANWLNEIIVAAGGKCFSFVGRLA